MEIEIYWEVDSALNSEESNALLESVRKLAQISGTFDFLAQKKISKPMCLNIIVVDDGEIVSMNAGYRNKNEATDVITFPFDETQNESHDADLDKLRFETTTEIMPNYAEIYISQDTAIRQSKEQNLSLLNEFIILIVHGLLHAFHFDHETSEESKTEMRDHEKTVLNCLGFKFIEPLTS
jgi:probable rRNA maturation factor